MSDQPKKKPKSKPYSKSSWQNSSNNKSVNRRDTNLSHPGDDPKKIGRRRYEVYKDHPKDADGNNVCYAKKKDGTHCMLPAGNRTAHPGYGKCSFHGGNTPTLSKAAAYHAGADVIDRMTMSYGYGQPIDITPQDALLQEVQRSAGHVFFLQDRISMWELTDEDGQLRAQPTEEQEWWMDKYLEERQHLAKVAKMAVDAGVAERRVQLAEQQGQILVAVLNQVFDQIGLTVEQRKKIPVIVPRVIRDATQPKPQFAGELEHDPENKL